MPFYGWISKACTGEEDKHVTQVQLVERSGKPQGVTLVNTEQTTKNHDPQDLVELARTVQKGDQFVRANAGNKLLVIADQMRYLQEQARKVLEDAKRDSDLHHAACNIVKRPGTVYHLYKRESGQTYLSLLSPQEWGTGCPHQFLGSYRLEYDMSWTPLEQLAKRTQEFAMIDKVLTANNALNESLLTLHAPDYKLGALTSSTLDAEPSSEGRTSGTQ